MVVRVTAAAEIRQRIRQQVRKWLALARDF